MSKSCMLFPQNRSRRQPCFTSSMATTLAMATIPACLDCCNSLQLVYQHSRQRDPIKCKLAVSRPSSKPSGGFSPHPEWKPPSLQWSTSLPMIWPHIPLWPHHLLAHLAPAMLTTLASLSTPIAKPLNLLFPQPAALLPQTPSMLTRSPSSGLYSNVVISVRPSPATLSEIVTASPHFISIPSNHHYLTSFL